MVGWGCGVGIRGRAEGRETEAEMVGDGQGHADEADEAYHDSGVFFIHGPGGTGKTFLYNLIAKAIHSNGQIVFCSASSGVAAILLHDGATAHSSFKIPIHLNESSSCKIELHSSLGDLFATQNVLCIWDEAPMISRYAPEALDRTLQDLRIIISLGGSPWFLGEISNRSYQSSLKAQGKWWCMSPSANLLYEEILLYST